MLQIETKLYYMYNYKYTEKEKTQKKTIVYFITVQAAWILLNTEKKNQRDCRHRRRRVNIYAKEKTEETLWIVSLHQHKPQTNTYVF